MSFTSTYRMVARVKETSVNSRQTPFPAALSGLQCPVSLSVTINLPLRNIDECKTTKIEKLFQMSYELSKSHPLSSSGRRMDK